MSVERSRTGLPWTLTCPEGHRGIVRGPPGAEFRCVVCDRAYSLVEDVRIDRTVRAPEIAVRRHD